MTTTDAATETVRTIERVTGRHCPTRPTADGGLTFESACGHYHGTVRPDGTCEAFDASGGGAGVPVRLVGGDDGNWTLARE